MTTTTQATTCPAWCQLDRHAEFADRISIRHRAHRTIRRHGREKLTVWLHAWTASETPAVTISLPEGRETDAELTAAEALEVAEAIRELTSAPTSTDRHLALAA